MITRRRFLASLAGTTLLPTTLLAAENPTELSYWQSVQAKFSIADHLKYFNNGTLGLSPKSVSEKVKSVMDEVDATGNHGDGQTLIASIAKFVGCSPDEIALTHNVTEGINIAAWSIPLKRGDEVILTNHEHVGGATPWLHRAKRQGLKIKVIELKPTAAEVLQTISESITKKTRVIAVPHIPCTNGQILPIQEISKLAKQKGCWLVVDGAHPPGMLQLNLHDLGVDTYSSCCHKWMLGPKGTGFIYVKKEIQDQLLPTYVGAGSDIGWDMLSTPPLYQGYAPNAHRYHYGTQNTALFSGVVAAIDFLEEIGMDRVELRCRSLAALFQQEILALGDRAEMLSPTEAASRSAVISFRLRNLPHDQFFRKALENKFRVRSVTENGLNCIRVSTHIYNQPEQIKEFVEWIYDVA